LERALELWRGPSQEPKYRTKQDRPAQKKNAFSIQGYMMCNSVADAKKKLNAATA
jgi:hypothetical protein